MPVALAPLAVGLLVLLVALALWLVAELIARLIGPNVPFIGGWIANQVRAAAGAVAHWTQTATDAAVGAVAWVFSTIAQATWGALWWSAAAVVHVGQLAQAGYNHALSALAAIPHAIAQAEQTAEGYAAQVAGHAQSTAIGHADSLFNRLGHDFSGALSAVHAQAVAGINHAEGDIVSLGQDVARAVTDLSGRIAAVEQALTGDVHALIAQIEADLNIATATAINDAAAAQAAAVAAAAAASHALVAGTEQALNQAAHDVVLGPWAALLSPLAGIASALPQTVAGPLGIAGAISEPVPVSLPGILGLIVPAVGAIASEVDSCLRPNCGPLQSLGGLMNGLSDLGLAALLLALVDQAVTDPAGGAAELVAAGEWVDGLAREFTSAVVG